MCEQIEDILHDIKQRTTKMTNITSKLDQFFSILEPHISQEYDKNKLYENILTETQKIQDGLDVTENWGYKLYFGKCVIDSNIPTITRHILCSQKSEESRRIYLMIGHIYYNYNTFEIYEIWDDSTLEHIDLSLISFEHLNN